MSSATLSALFAIGIGVVILIAIRRSNAAKRYLNASERDADTLGKWLATRYLRKRDWLEIAVLAASPLLFIAILYAWSWWHGDV